MSKKIKILIAVLAALIVLLIGAIVIDEHKSGTPAVNDNGQITEEEPQNGDGADTDDSNTTSTMEEADKTISQSDESGEKKTYTPTFVYFINSEQEAETKDTLDKLKKEYEGRVNFDIRNIDETGEDLEDSIGNDNMPALFMHNSNNDICALLIKTYDYGSLKAAIEKAFD